MKGFFRWFKNSSKMKRWMFIIVIGILLACYGIAEILVLKEISFKEVGKNNSNIYSRIFSYNYRASRT